MEINQNKRELFRFLITGILAVGTDFITYQFLIEILNSDYAKSISFVAGSVIAFFINKIWTFENNTEMHTAAIQFITLYAFTFIANVAVNHAVLQFFNNMTLLGFLAATATSTILNFIGMKFWVFSENTNVNGFNS